MHNSSVHTENGFWAVPVAVAYRGKRSDQATTMFSGTSARSPFNTERRRPTLAAFPKKQDSENIVQILTYTRRLSLSPSFYFQFILYPSQPLESNNKVTSCRPQSWWLFSIQSRPLYHYIRYSEVDMLCFRSVMLVRSFTANKSSGTRHQPLLHAIRNIFVFVLVLPPIEMICKMCCPTSVIRSTVVLEYAMWSSARETIPSDPVALEGWSSVRDRTNRKHCPSHEIWSYKRDGRWWGWSFDRGSTVMMNTVHNMTNSLAEHHVL